MQRILLYHQGAIGDLVTLFPVLLHLRREYGTIDLICQGPVGRLARHLKLVDKTYPAESALFASLFSGASLQQIPDIFASYQVVVVFSNSEHLSHALQRVTPAAVHRIAPRPLPGLRRHITDHYFHELSVRGVLKSEYFPPADRGPLTNGRMPDAGACRILLHPGSGSKLKNWPLKHFLTVEKQLKSKGLKPEHVLGPAEDRLLDLSQPLPGVVHRPSDLTGLTELLLDSGGLIGNDSGVTHLAAFIGLPTLAIFGPSDPVRWRPRGPRVEIVAAADACAPCFETAHGRCRSSQCLESITPTMVVAHFLRLRKAAQAVSGKL